MRQRRTWWTATSGVALAVVGPVILRPPVAQASFGWFSYGPPSPEVLDGLVLVVDAIDRGEATGAISKPVGPARPVVGPGVWTHDRFTAALVVGPVWSSVRSVPCCGARTLAEQAQPTRCGPPNTVRTPAE